MAVEGAQFQFDKFCNSLGESKNQISVLPLASDFRAIEEYLQQNQENWITVSPVQSLKLLCRLNDLLAEYRIFAHHCNQLNKNIACFNLLTIKWFLRKRRPKLREIRAEFEILASEIEKVRRRLARSDGWRKLPAVTGINGCDKMASEIEKVVLRGGYEDFIAYGITGMAGTGKTALAQHVFDSDRIRSKFRRRIWVSVSDRGDSRAQYQKTASLIKMLKCITKELNYDPDEVLRGTDDTDFFQVLVAVQNRLSEHKFLIVLDDIWEENELYQSVLRGMSKAVGANGGAIIVTSRQEDLVKRMVGKHGFSTRLDRRNEKVKEDCWKIFEDGVAKGGIEKMDHERLVKIEDDIKYKIQGLPFAAQMLAHIIPQQIRRATIG